MDLVHELERRVLPSFHDLAARLNGEIPRVVAQVYSHPVGSRTDFQGHALGVECRLLDTPAGRPDNVALEVGLRHLTSDAKLDASVCWGDPSGHAEAELLPTPIAATEAASDELLAALPRLAAALREALRRGQPPEE